MARERYSFSSIRIVDHIRSVPVVHSQMPCLELLNIFRVQPDLECVVIHDDQLLPLGLIMKRDFYLKLGSLYGRSLYRAKSVDYFMNGNPLCAELDMEPQQLIDKALTRPEGALYDAVILLKDEQLAGVMTMSDLMNMSRLIQREAVDQQLQTIRSTEAMIERIQKHVSNVQIKACEMQAYSEQVAERSAERKGKPDATLDVDNHWPLGADQQAVFVAEWQERMAAVHKTIGLIGDVAVETKLLAHEVKEQLRQLSLNMNNAQNLHSVNK